MYIYNHKIIINQNSHCLLKIDAHFTVYRPAMSVSDYDQTPLLSPMGCTKNNTAFTFLVHRRSSKDQFSLILSLSCQI